MPLSLPSLGIPLPVDPGPQRIVVQAPNRVASILTIDLAPGETRKIALEIPAATPQPSAPAKTPPVVAIPSNAASDRTPSYILGAVGVEGLAVGTVTGLLAWQKKATINRDCVEHVCSADGKSAADSARSLALVSTTSFALAAASLLGAAWLWDTGKEQKNAVRGAVVSDGRSNAVLSLGGTF
jgi:hypothetical protein